jgi:hypothetical protein
MLIDEIAIPPEIDFYYKESLAALTDQAFILGCRKLPALMEGLNQKSPSIKTLRARVSGKLEGKSLPGPILELLREATLSERLFAALSTRAIKHGGDDWASYFGVTPYVGSLLLDEREEVRVYARDGWPRLSKKLSTASTPSTDTIQLVGKFGPLLQTLGDLLNGSGYSKPTLTQPSVIHQKVKLSHDEETKLIEGSTLVKRLQREVKEATANLATKTSEYTLLQAREKKALTDLQLAQNQLETLARELQGRVAQGVSDALLHRLGTWIQPCEVLAEGESTQPTAIEQATAILKKQAQIDARFGTVSRLNAELAETFNLKDLLQNALNESLRPLPELQDAIASLELKIQEIDSTLKRGTIAPDTARLEGVSRRLNSAQTIEEALSVKASVTSEITKQVWSHNESTKALDLVNRRVLTLYAQHGQRNHVRREDLHKIAPLETLRQCLITADSCCILIDGHNLLHKVKPFIGGQYFDPATGPNALARSYLIEKLRTLVDLHTNINCELWFDGPDDTQWRETDRLKVLFSGGQGENRADARILESLHGLTYRGVSAEYIVVSDDRDILKKSENSNAVGMSPVEFWMGFLAT